MFERVLNTPHYTSAIITLIHSHDYGFFLYPLKTSENLFSNVFKGCRKKPVALNELKRMKLLTISLLFEKNIEPPTLNQVENYPCICYCIWLALSAITISTSKDRASSIFISHLLNQSSK